MSVHATDAERWYREHYATTRERHGSFTTLSGEATRQRRRGGLQDVWGSYTETPVF